MLAKLQHVCTCPACFMSYCLERISAAWANDVGTNPIDSIIQWCLPGELVKQHGDAVPDTSSIPWKTQPYRFLKASLRFQVLHCHMMNNKLEL